MTTNEASRQQLKTLAVPRLNLTFSRPTLALFEELETLVLESTKTLGIRYVTNRIATEPKLLLCEPLQSFEKIVIVLWLPRPARIINTAIGQYIEDDPNSPTLAYVKDLIKLLEAADEDVQERYEVYNVTGWEASNDMSSREKIWPVAVEETEVEVAVIDEKKGTSEKREIEGAGHPSTVTRTGKATAGTGKSSSKSQWERQTNYNILGGLIGLSLESKKY
jgi:hypothetical protein